MMKLKLYQFAILLLGIIISGVAIELSRTREWDRGYLYASIFPMTYACSLVLMHEEYGRKYALVVVPLQIIGFGFILAAISTGNLETAFFFLGAQAILHLIFDLVQWRNLRG